MAYSEVFAGVYDAFTKNVNYKKRAAYIQTVLKRYQIDNGLVLDLACGTGGISIPLAKMGYEIIGVDLSQDMLLKARQKAQRQKTEILFLCQDITRLDLFGTVKAAVCTLDSINHLPCKEEVQRAFDRVFLFMEPGGVFLFDVNTLYKHKEVLGNNSFVYETKNAMLVWQNFYHKRDHSVDIMLDVFRENKNGTYVRGGEEFTEYFYSPSELTAMLTNAGFQNINVYGDLTFERPGRTEQRITFVAEKNKR